MQISGMEAQILARGLQHHYRSAATCWIDRILPACRIMRARYGTLNNLAAAIPGAAHVSAPVTNLPPAAHPQRTHYPPAKTP
jgi:hypothetical protein